MAAAGPATARADGVLQLDACVDVVLEFLQSKCLYSSEQMVRTEVEAYKQRLSQDDLAARNLFSSRLEGLLGLEMPKSEDGPATSLPIVDMTPVEAVIAGELDESEPTSLAPGGCAKAIKALGTDRVNRLNTRTKLYELSRVGFDDDLALRSRRGRGAKSQGKQVLFHDGDPMTEEQQHSIAQISLPILYNPNLGGLEDTPEVDLSAGTVIAQRYRVVASIGSGSFSQVVQCLDMRDKMHVAVKVARNDKDCTDQGLAEVRLLAHLQASDSRGEQPLVRLLDYFYHKEHLMIVTELLRDSIFEFYRYLNATVEPDGAASYFTTETLAMLGSQLLSAVAFLHEHGIMHCDIKPENVCVVSTSRRKFKLIDFGSAVFNGDSRNSYVQSRWYRAPEVMLGMPWDNKMDVWGVGCVLAEVVYGQPLFYGKSVETVLASHQAALGRFPDHMRLTGLAHVYLSRDGDIYTVDPPGCASGAYYVLPRTSSLRELLIRPGGGMPRGERRLDYYDSKEEQAKREPFVEFLSNLLCLDPRCRLTAAQAYEHPWLRRMVDGQAASSMPRLPSGVFGSAHSPVPARLHPSHVSPALSRPLSPAASLGASPSGGGSSANLSQLEGGVLCSSSAQLHAPDAAAQPRAGGSMPRVPSLNKVQSASDSRLSSTTGARSGRRGSEQAQDGPFVPEEFRNSLTRAQGEESPRWSKQWRHKFVRMLSAKERDARASQSEPSLKAAAKASGRSSPSTVAPATAPSAAPPATHAPEASPPMPARPKTRM